MKLILLFGLLFMVSCDQAALEEALMTESGDTVEKAVLDLPPTGVEIFDTFDYSGFPGLLDGTNLYRRCEIDSNGLYRQVTIFISGHNDTEKPIFDLAVLVYYTKGHCLGIVEYNHNYKMKVTIHDGVAYVDNFDFRVMNMNDTRGPYDDCDYSESILDSNCHHDFKSFQHDFVAIDESAIRLDGKVYRSSLPLTVFGY